ncbi:hypothetical protein VCV18_012588 [Metarhizium anisopliae]
MASSSTINARAMRYTGNAYNCLKSSDLRPSVADSCHEDIDGQEAFSSRNWGKREKTVHDPRISPELGRRVGRYPFTSPLASWVVDAFINYQPSEAATDLVRRFSAELHEAFGKERMQSDGLHNLILTEVIYQITLEVGGEILLAADKSPSCVDVRDEYHSSHVAGDDHFVPWGKLLTGLDCDPPIISHFPFYLMMCQSVVSGNYVYSALTGVDWAKGKNAYSDRFKKFEKLVRKAVVDLDGKFSGQDRSFWRFSLAYLSAMDQAETSKEFTTPQASHIRTDLDPYLLMAVRGFDTIGSAYMCSDGAAFFDKEGMDSLIGSAVPNDVMDLHTDILTGETRNLLRLLYPNSWSIEKSVKTMSMVFSGMLCELFRGHKRARLENREDGRIAATSPAYSFCRARHRRIFEIIEAYTDKYPEFWDWTREIYRLAKEQMTEAGLNELPIQAPYRALNQDSLPESPHNEFYDGYLDMIEKSLDGIDQSENREQVKRALGVQNKLGELLPEHNKTSGWGGEFDEKSDYLFRQVGELLYTSSRADTSTGWRIPKEVYRFAIAYGRLSMSLPYIAYHTIVAIIPTYGVVSTR